MRRPCETFPVGRARKTAWRTRVVSGCKARRDLKVFALVPARTTDGDFSLATRGQCLPEAGTPSTWVSSGVSDGRVTTARRRCVIIGRLNLPSQGRHLVGTPQPPAMTVREPLLALTDRYSGPSAEQVLARLQQPDMQGIKGIVSWRGAFLTDDACPVEMGLAYLRLLQQESCGRCGPCRIGVDIMIELIEKLVAGTAEIVGGEDPVARIRRLAESIDDAAWCGIGNTIGPPIVALLDLAPEHFAAHAEGSTCEPSAKHGWVTAPCRSTCPSTLDIPWYIFHGLEEHPHLATRIVKRDNPLPAIIGRTCPHPCEANCSLAPIGQPIAINNIKRWCADRAEDLATDQCASGCLLDPDQGRLVRVHRRRRRSGRRRGSHRGRPARSDRTGHGAARALAARVNCRARRAATATAARRQARRVRKWQ